VLTLDEEDPLDDNNTNVTIDIDNGPTYTGRINPGNSQIENQ